MHLFLKCKTSEQSTFQGAICIPSQNGKTRNVSRHSFFFQFFFFLLFNTLKISSTKTSPAAIVGHFPFSTRTKSTSLCAHCKPTRQAFKRSEMLHPTVYAVISKSESTNLVSFKHPVTVPRCWRASRHATSS